MSVIAKPIPTESDLSPEFQDLGDTQHITAGNNAASNASNSTSQNGESDAISDASASVTGKAAAELGRLLPVVEATKHKVSDYFFGASQRSFTATIRNPMTFLSPTQFSRPESSKDLMLRIYVNLRYFLANYILLAMLFALFNVLTSPLAFLGTIVVAMFILYSMKVEEFKVGRFAIKGKFKNLGTIVIALLLVILLGILDAITFGAFMASILSVGHAGLHKPMLTNAGTDNDDVELGDNTSANPLESSGFLNSSPFIEDSV